MSTAESVDAIVAARAKEALEPGMCAICLGEPACQPAHIVPCFHSFCVLCVLRWLEIKGTCPLCKQTGRALVHNLRSATDFDTIDLRTPAQQDPAKRQRTSGRSSAHSSGAGARGARPNWGQPQQDGAGSSSSRTSADGTPQISPGERRRVVYRRGLIVQPMRCHQAVAGVGALDSTAGRPAQRLLLTPGIDAWVRREVQAILDGVDDTSIVALFAISLFQRACGIPLEAELEKAGITPMAPGRPAGAVELCPELGTGMARRAAKSAQPVRDTKGGGMQRAGKKAQLTVQTILDELRPFIHDAAEQFLMETTRFGASPYSIAEYDRLVRYLIPN